MLAIGPSVAMRQSRSQLVARQLAQAFALGAEHDAPGAPAGFVLEPVGCLAVEADQR